MMISKEKYEVVLACGGFGTRLKEITNNTPKPLFPVNGLSTLERCIQQLENYHFKNVLITIGYKSEKFIKYIYELNQKYRIDIDIYIEENPLGNVELFGKLRIIYVMILFLLMAILFFLLILKNYVFSI